MKIIEKEKSLWGRNRYIQILMKNGSNRKQMDFIMKDIDKSGIFNKIDNYEPGGKEEALSNLFNKKVVEVKEEINGCKHGRSYLHEAIATKDLKFVKRCIKEGKYLEDIDNNGNTPREMAYYEGWLKVVELFDKARKE